MRILFFTLFLFLSFGHLMAQDDNASVVKLGQALVESDFSWSELQKQKLDSATLHLNASASLGDVLVKQSQWRVMQYGASGMAQSSRVNGLSSDHTALSWNGVPLNSLSLGTADLSLVPAYFFDEVSMYGFAGSLQFSGSTFGGAIDLNNTVVKGNMVELMTSFNNLHNLTQGFKVNWQQGPWQYSGKVLFSGFKNDFIYEDVFKSDSPLVNQKHNQAKQWGTLHTLAYVFKPGNQLKGGLWLNERSAQLPEMMGSYGESFARQYDQGSKAYLSWDFAGDKHFYHSMLAYGFDAMHYTDQAEKDGPLLIDSRIENQQLLVEFSDRWYFRPAQSFLFKARYFDNTVQTSYYSGGQANEHRLSLIAGYNLTLPKGKLLFNLNETLLNGRFYAPALSFSGEHFWMLGKQEKLRLNALVGMARKYRLPDFNEKYWVPGGNPDLRPEDGIQLYAEAGLSEEVNENALSFSLRYSSAFIQNWIEWVPAGSFYEPRNLKEVQTQSVKALAIWSRKTGAGAWSLQTSYQYTHAVIPASAIYLPYAPKHEAGAQLGWRYKRWTASANYRFTGQCYSDLSNNPHHVMSAYSLLDLSAGRHFYWRQSALLLSASIDNVANTSYQVVRAYALPGRVIGLSVKWNYNFKKQIE